MEIDAIKKFWKKVDVHDGRILLDGRLLRTPTSTPFHLHVTTSTHSMDTDGMLLAAAGEWESAETMVKPHVLPITSNLFRANIFAQDAHTREGVVKEMIQYLNNDTLLHRVEYPEVLVKEQQRVYPRLVSWCEQRYGVTLIPSTSLFGVKQPKETMDKMVSVMKEMDPVRFAGLEDATRLTKSLILSLALVYREIGVREAVEVATVESRIQAGQWGWEDGLHGVEKEGLRHRLGAVALLSRPNPS